MRNKRVLCFTLSLIFFISLISFKQIKTNAVTANKPEFSVKITEVTPNPVFKGNDITIKGFITPQEFQISSPASKPRDMIIVIDKGTYDNGMLNPLVNSIQSFISSMQNNDKYKDTRVGIISYNKEAQIHTAKINNTDAKLVNVYKYGEEIKKQMLSGNSIKAESNENSGNTNTGEALRKAEYLLHSNEANKNAEKIIILVSDSEPASRTVDSDNGTEIFFTDISKEGYDTANIVYKDNNKNIEYANRIGEIVRNNRDKVFTLSFNTNNKSEINESINNVLKNLHETMLGYSIGNNTTENENLGFFITNSKDSKIISDIFNKIELQISNSYKIDDAKMSIELKDGFSLEIEGNTINLEDITYKLSSTEDEIKNGVYRYEYIGQPIYFEFTIKANKIGKDQEIFKDIDIIYTWEDKEINQSIDLNPPIKITVNENIEYTGPDIRILEVEPADSFKLTSKINERVTTGTETILRSKNNKEYKIEITHITMAEFIGKIEQLNGKYDVIVIGRYIDNDLSGPNGIINYSGIKYSSISISENLKNKTWFNDYSHLENDITNKKAKEIREFIQSGQLVYIDKSIGDNSNNNPYNNHIDWTKLYYHLTNNQGDFLRDNLGSLSNLIRDKKIYDINIDDILAKYIEQSNKNLNKPIIYSTSPEGDTFEALGDINKRNMIFNIAYKNPKDEELTINLYLDINGDGLFKEDEKVKSIIGVNFSKGIYELQYNIYEDYPQFIGYLDWKIEVVKNNTGYSQPIKSYCEGNILFRRLEGEDKRIINVLQILPILRDNITFNQDSSEGKWLSNAWYSGNLNLDKNTLFQGLLNKPEVSDYDINIEVISYQDFYRENYYGPGREELNKSKYDMIIMGFSDMYPEEGISNEAVEQLKKYVEAGKSLMLTHDTLTYWKAWDNLGNASYLMKAFRDISGQSRYIDKLNPDQKDLNGDIISHDPNKPTDNIKKENGSTFLSMYDGLNADTTESNTVYKTNKTVLTSYPFKIEDNEIPIRETHGQYFQLNLEDEDTVPILNLTEQNGTDKGNYKNSISYNNRYDSRNFYYTYSRGNITFSGTGENGRDQNEYPESEMKLFVNTIVKAERGANHKPIISGLSEEENTEVAATKDFNFNIVVKDPDKDKVKINSIVVQGEDISSINDLSTEYKESGTSYALKITSDILSKYINKEIIIKIEAEDEKKAISIKEYKIKVVSDAIITPKTVERKLVINQAESFIIELETENDTNPTSIFVDNNIENPQIEGIFGIESIKPINDNGKLKLEIKNLISYQKEKGREINIPLKYTTGNKEKSVIIKIIYDSDYIRTEVPDIKVELTSEKDIEIEDSKEITLEYTITPQEFTTNELGFNSKEITDVIIISDLSENMRYGQRDKFLQNGIFDGLVNNLMNTNINFGVIGYNENYYIADKSNEIINNRYFCVRKNVTKENLISPLFNISNNTEKENFRIIFQEDSYLRNNISGSTRNISSSLERAKDIFDNFGTENGGKAIILINSGEVTYNENILQTIKSQNYKIISVDISNNLECSNKLVDLHKKLGGIYNNNNESESDYIRGTDSGGNYNSISSDMKKVADRINSSTQSNNSLNVTPIFTFDLNDNFEYIQGSNTNINYNNLNDNELKFTLKTSIEYTYSNTQNEKGEYIFTAPTQIISFKVKVKDDKTGVLNFAENTNILDISTYKNYFEYTNFKGTINKKSLETPTVLVDDQMVVTNLKHGLYEGIDSILENTDDELKENGNTRFEFYSPSKVKFVVSFETTSKSIKGTLNIDDKFDEVKSNDINIYKVKDNKLEKINLSSESIKEIGNNNFEINIKNINENKENIKILIVYDASINSTNNIFINDFLDKKIKVKSLEENSNILPDLF